MKEGKKVSGRGSTGRVDKSAKPGRSRSRTGEDHHARVWTTENCTQEELMRLVPKEPRLRPVYRGKVNVKLDAWFRLLESRYE